MSGVHAVTSRWQSADLPPSPNEMTSAAPPRAMTPAPTGASSRLLAHVSVASAGRSFAARASPLPANYARAATKVMREHDDLPELSLGEHANAALHAHVERMQREFDERLGLLPMPNETDDHSAAGKPSAFSVRVQRADCVRALLTAMAHQFATLRPLLRRAAAEIASTVSEGQGVDKSVQNLATIVGDFEEEFGKRVNTVRCDHLGKIADVQRLAAVRDKEVDAAQSLTAELQGQVAKLHDAMTAADATIKQRDEQVREMAIDVAVKRQSLQETEVKVNEVIKENRFLRNITAHCDELLRDAEELKTQVADGKATLHGVMGGHDRREKELQHEVDVIRKQVQQQHLVVDHQQEELGLLRRACTQAQNTCATLRRQRDELATVSTPRPRLTPLLALLDVHCTEGTEVGAAGRQRTAALVSSLVAKTTAVAAELRAVKARSESQSKALPMFADDDFEVVQLKGPGAATFSARVIPALGAHNTAVPPHLRFDGFEGVVTVRHMAASEVAALMHEFRSWRTAQPPVPLHTPLNAEFSTALHGFFRARSTAPHEAADTAYSFTAALDLHQGIAQMETFRQCAAGTLPPDFYDVVLARTTQLIASLRHLFTKLMPPPPERTRGGKPPPPKAPTVRRRLFHEVLSQQWPTLTDGELLRLRAVVNAEAEKHSTERDTIPFEVLLDEGASVSTPLLPVPAALLRAATGEAMLFAADVGRVLSQDDGDITPHLLHDAITEADADQPAIEANAVVQRVFGESAQGLPLSTVLRLLPAAMCRRVGPRVDIVAAPRAAVGTIKADTRRNQGSRKPSMLPR
jgi:hypothetical protein